MLLNYIKMTKLKNMKKCEYIAIKVIGLDRWLWFKTENITEEDGRFIGLKGWGKNGNYTEIDVNSNEIIGRIHSDYPQYE